VRCCRGRVARRGSATHAPCSRVAGARYGAGAVVGASAVGQVCSVCGKQQRINGMANGAANSTCHARSCAAPCYAGGKWQARGSRNSARQGGRCLWRRVRRRAAGKQPASAARRRPRASANATPPYRYMKSVYGLAGPAAGRLRVVRAPEEKQGAEGARTGGRRNH